MKPLTIWLLLFLAVGVAYAADEHGHVHGSKKPAAIDDHDEHDEHDHHDHHGHENEVHLSEDAIRVYGVQVGPATQRALAPTLTAPGRVAFNADAVAHVGSPVRGRAVEIRAKVGSVVARGDVLLVIESPELGEAQSDLVQKHAAMAVAAATTQPAAESYERARALYGQNEGIALAEVQKRHAELRAAEGSLLTARAAAQAAENKLHLMGMDQKAIDALLNTGQINPRYELRAPIAGTVIEREVTQGELVNPDKDALLMLADLSSLWVWAEVPEAKLGGVKVGSPAVLYVGASAETVDGKVAQIAAQIDPATRAGKVRIDVANPAGVLRPGMFAKVELTTGDPAGPPVLVVPDDAIQTIDGNPCVFVPVPGEPNTFQKRLIRTAPAVGGYVPVLDGLKPGEPVVVKGSFILKADLGKSGAGHQH